MPTRSAPKVQRWIDLLAALLVRRYPITFEQLCEEVPAYAASASGPARRRMFERDKDELRTLGVPILTAETGDGTEGYRLERREFYLPYLDVRLGAVPAARRRALRDGYRDLPQVTFEPDELRALTEGAAQAAALGDPSLAEAVRSALAKLGFDLPVETSSTLGDALATTWFHVPTLEQHGDVFETLGDALRRRKRVTVRYHSIGRDATGERVVEPYGLFFLSRHWYLAARDPSDDVVKNFRVSRIADATVEPQRPQTPDYAIPADFSLREHARSRTPWELGDGAGVPATVEFRRRTGEVRAAEALGEPVEGHPARRRFAVRRADSFARWLLAFGGDAVAIDPPALREALAALARETLDRYPEEA